MLSKKYADRWAHAVAQYIRTGYIEPDGPLVSYLQSLNDPGYPLYSVDRRHAVARSAAVFLHKFIESKNADPLRSGVSVNVNIWVILSVEVAMHEVEGCFYGDQRRT